MSEQTQSPVASELQKLDTAIEQLKYKRAFLLLHQTVIEQMGLKPCCACGAFIDFDNPTRAQVVDILIAFGGKWSKEPAGDGTIDYKQPIDGGIVLRLYRAEPPPSCRLIEEDVVIPAQPERIEKRTRLVCKEVAEVAPEPYPVPDAYSVPAAERSAQ